MSSGLSELQLQWDVKQTSDYYYHHYFPSPSLHDYAEGAETGVKFSRRPQSYRPGVSLGGFTVRAAFVTLKSFIPLMAESETQLEKLLSPQIFN